MLSINPKPLIPLYPQHFHHAAIPRFNANYPTVILSASEENWPPNNLIQLFATSHNLHAIRTNNPSPHQAVAVHIEFPGLLRKIIKQEANQANKDLQSP